MNYWFQVLNIQYQIVTGIANIPILTCRAGWLPVFSQPGVVPFDSMTLR